MAKTGYLGRCIYWVHRFLQHKLWLVSELFALFRGKRFRYRVQGDSMQPHLGDGDVILIDTSRKGRPKVGQVVVAKDPTHLERIIVKRVRSLGERAAYLGSDNPNVGRDSRQFGSVDFDLIMGPVSLVWKQGKLLFHAPDV